MELFLEPELPTPRVVVVGESPIVGALKTFGPELGLEVTAGVDRLDGKIAPRAGDLALIVAAHGRGELETLKAGLEAGVPYIGLVASPKRGATVLDDLRGEGVPEDQVTRIDSPAGLDIGARSAAEIAVSILASVIAVRRGHSDEELGLGTAQEDVPEPQIVVDPICGMTVVVVPGTPSAQSGAETAYFCCQGCKDAYERQRQAA